MSFVPSTVLTPDFNQVMLAFARFLERLQHQVPALESSKVEQVKADIEELRLAALEAEIRTRYPDARISRRLLKLVGIDQDIPVEKEIELLTRILEEAYGYSGAV